MQGFDYSRALIALQCCGAAQASLDEAWAYAKEREAFGKPIGKFQHNRFLLAEMATEVHIARVFVNDCVLKLNAGEVDTSLASMAKWWTTELQNKLAGQAVQLHGGYGYMREYAVERFARDARLMSIGGGTSEIMKDIIAKAIVR